MYMAGKKNSSFSWMVYVWRGKSNSTTSTKFFCYVVGLWELSTILSFTPFSLPVNIVTTIVYLSLARKQFSPFTFTQCSCLKAWFLFFNKKFRWNQRWLYLFMLVLMILSVWSMLQVYGQECIPWDILMGKRMNGLV